MLKHEKPSILLYFQDNSSNSMYLWICMPSLKAIEKDVREKNKFDLSSDTI